MLDSTLIRRKLAAMFEHLNVLEPLSQISLEEYVRDPIRRHAAEKLVELVVEFASDVNRAILQGLDKMPPQTYYNSFLELSQLGIIPPGLMPRLASATGLRNRLVHRYESLDNEAAYYSLQPLARNYREYGDLIEAFLEGEEKRQAKKPAARKSKKRKAGSPDGL